MSKQLASLSGVSVEWDDAKHPRLRVREGKLDKAKIMRSARQDDEFIPARIVIDLKLDLGDEKAATVNLDNVHLKIAYQGEQPIIGWWNGARWVKFKQVAYADNIADVTLPSPWPTDPGIGTYP